mgnify:CR=1 FL=1
MLTLQGQLKLFDATEQEWKERSYKEWGTFKDNLRTPVHRWFTYPAGFSYKAVQASIKSYNIKQGQWIYDPFMGSGTTNLTAKTLGINSIGIEPHPFVFPIAKTKLNTEISLKRVFSLLEEIEKKLASTAACSENISDDLEKEFPELILKCYLKGYV